MKKKELIRKLNSAKGKPSGIFTAEPFKRGYKKIFFTDRKAKKRENWSRGEFTKHATRLILLKSV